MMTMTMMMTIATMIVIDEKDQKDRNPALAPVPDLARTSGRAPQRLPSSRLSEACRHRSAKRWFGEFWVRSNVAFRQEDTLHLGHKMFTAVRF